jgi:choloylglycine hydrolase
MLASKVIALGLAGLMLSLSVLPAAPCTALVFKAQDGTAIYARTMEWGASDLKSELALVPQATSFKSALGAGKTGMEWKNRYGFVGVNAAGLPYATDGMNEAGLTVGVLFFPGFAEFQEPSADQQSATVSSVDLANYLLSNFATVDEAR